MEPWKRYPLHLVVAAFAALGAVAGLDGPNSALGGLFWLACIGGALLNAACFGIGWERRRTADRTQDVVAPRT